MNDQRWRILLSLQGGFDGGEPIPSPEIISSKERVKMRFHSTDVYKFFPIKSFPRILVIGAGYGVEVSCFNGEGYSTEGVVLMHKNKKYAKKHFNIDLHLEDMHYMHSFSPGSFDGVYSNHTLEHSLAPMVVLFEIRRVLRVGGRLFFSVPLPGGGTEKGIQHYSVLSTGHWLHLMDLMGFENIVNKGYTFQGVRSNKQCPGMIFERRMKEAGIWDRL